MSRSKIEVAPARPGDWKRRMGNRRGAAVLAAAVSAGVLLAACQSPGQGARLYRDAWGVPHAFAEQEEDAYYALGYAHAEDRPERFYQLVLWGSGQWAAAQGAVTTPIGAPAQALDLQNRQWRHAEEARAAFERLDPEVQARHRAYAEGFERYFDEHPELKPDWAPELEPWHFTAIIRSIFWQFSLGVDGQGDCRRLTDQVAAADGFGSDLASNVWVIQASRTSDGQTYLVSDPHGPIDGGLIFNEYNVHAGDLNASVFGIGPVPVTAQTQRIAWGATTGQPDLSDCYVLTINPDNPRQYLFDGEWRDMVVREASVEVAGGEPIETEFEYTEHNGVLSPVVAREDDRAFAVSSPYMHLGETGVDQLHAWLEAGTVDDILEISADPEVWGQNFMFADHEGGALFLRMGRAPIRDSAYDSLAALPGDVSDAEWTGIHGVEDLVQLRDPASGYMFNANEAPDRLTAPQPTPGLDAYAPYLVNEPGFVTSRSHRLEALLSIQGEADLDSVLAITFDETLPHAHRWRDAAAQAAGMLPEAAAALDADAGAVFADVQDFDGVVAQESMPAARFLYWREALWETLSADQARMIRGSDPTAELDEITPDAAAALIAAAERAAERMRALHGSIDIAYGDAVRIGRGEEDWPLSGGTMCLSAQGRICDETLRAFRLMPADDGGERRPMYGSRILRIAEFGEEARGFTAFGYGQSDDPESPHYDDQAEALFSGRELKPVHWSEASLLEAGAAPVELPQPANGEED